MDRADVRLLEELQRDSARSIAELAEACGLSSSALPPADARAGGSRLITGYAARVDSHLLGLKLHAFVEITLTSQSRDAMDRFEAAVQGL